jgi:hypothetical protein
MPEEGSCGVKAKLVFTAALVAALSLSISPKEGLMTNKPRIVTSIKVALAGRYGCLSAVTGGQNGQVFTAEGRGFDSPAPPILST